MINTAYETVDQLLPHAHPMILIDRVVAYREGYIQTALTIHQNSLFIENGEVPSYISLEYMAQTVGVWNGLFSRQNNKEPNIGFLLGTRQLTLEIPSFKLRDCLDIYGETKYVDEEMASFECWVEKEGHRVAHAILNVFQPKNVEMRKES